MLNAPAFLPFPMRRVPAPVAVRRYACGTPSAELEAPRGVWLRRDASGSAVAAEATFRPAFGHSFADVRVHASEPPVATRPVLEVGPADAPQEREADRAAEAVISDRTPDLGLASPQRIARSPQYGTERMHEALADRWRREHGLPEGGVDESGRRVGPSTGAITHSGAAVDASAPCPPADDEMALLCLTADRADHTVTCRMSQTHLDVLATARSAAAARVRRAVQRMTAPTPALRGLIVQQARKSFAGRPPAYESVLATLTTMQGLLEGTAMRLEGAACNDEGCYSGGTMAYVQAAGQQPVYVCMRSFNPRVRARLAGTLIHESAHVAGVATADPRNEAYCDNAGCEQECLAPENADAWRHFVDCVGAGLPIRADFDRETVRSVEEGL
ncbi:MAG: hypothetical protein JWM27_3313 [Gemmatimonadetes bacterium]|nr:hypothetical protein [Gemmatimonadota bacterium]